MKSQKARLLDILKDGQWHSNFELVKALANGGLCFRLGARVWDLKRDGYCITGGRISRQEYVYRLHLCSECTRNCTDRMKELDDL